MNLLTLDTTTASAAGLLAHGKLFAGTDPDALRSVERLVPIINHLLERGAVLAEELDQVAVVAGPGSFLGSRIGMITAQMIAKALRIPWFGVSALDALAFQAFQKYHFQHLVAVLDAKRQEVFCQEYRLADGGLSSSGVAQIELEGDFAEPQVGKLGQLIASTDPAVPIVGTYGKAAGSAVIESAHGAESGAIAKRVIFEAVDVLELTQNFARGWFKGRTVQQPIYVRQPDVHTSTPNTSAPNAAPANPNPHIPGAN
jgi:tRNA threonylcarbamoyl adenosine modification protein YeaZ